MVFYRKGCRERRVFKLIIHQSFYAIFLCAAPRPLRFISYLWFFTAEDAESAEGLSSLFTNLFMLYFSAQLRVLCGLYPIYGFLPQRSQRAQRVQAHYSPIFLCHISLRSSASSAVYILFMVFYRRGCRERRGFKLIIHQSFYAIFLCAALRPLRFISYLWFFTAEVAESAEGSSSLFTNLFMPYFSAQLCVLCGLYPTIPKISVFHFLGIELDAIALLSP